MHAELPKDSGPMAPFYRDAGSFALLTADEERDLASRGPEGRAALVRHNLRLVVWVARRYQGRGLEMADLVGHGNLGLIRAAAEVRPDARLPVLHLRRRLDQAGDRPRTRVRCPARSGSPSTSTT